MRRIDAMTFFHLIARGAVFEAPSRSERMPARERDKRPVHIIDTRKADAEAKRQRKAAKRAKGVRND